MTDCDTEIASCDKDVKIHQLNDKYIRDENLTTGINHLAACYRCSDNKIPLSHLTIATDKLMNNNAGGPVTECVEAQQSPIANCGFLLDLGEGAVCVACAPGFKPVSAESKITECQQIEFCDVNSPIKIFNGCAKCQENYLHAIDSQ